MNNMSHLRRILPTLAATALLGVGAATLSHAASPAASSVSQPIMAKPKELSWKPGPPALPPGAQMAVIEGDPAAEGKLFAFRLKVPAGYRIPAHFHSADEHVTVISGEFLMGMGDKLDESKAQALPAGSFVVIPAKEHHFAFTRKPAEVQVHAIGPWGITYVDPKDDPRNAATGGSGTPKQP